MTDSLVLMRLFLEDSFAFTVLFLTILCSLFSQPEIAGSLIQFMPELGRELILQNDAGMAALRTFAVKIYNVYLQINVKSY